MSRACLFGVLTLIAAGAAVQVQAAACDFKSTVMLGETQAMDIHECWDLTGWPADKARAFCQAQSGEEGAAQTTFLSACPTAALSGQCKSTFRAPSAASMPEAYFSRMPKEMADQIKAQMNAANPLRAFDGLPTTVHYYAPTPPQTRADQQTDCVQGKNGRFTPAG